MITPDITHVQMEYPKLVLHFDVNKTLINKDTVTGKTTDEVLINQLAEDTVYKWDPHHPEMSFKSYVETVLVPGDSSNSAIKKERRKIISDFLEIMRDYPEISNNVHEDFQKLKEKASDSVFSSFVALIEKLREQHFDFIIILRTFGNDLKEVQDEVQKKTGIVFTQSGEFKKGVLHLKGKENRTIEKTNDIYQHFAQSNEHIAIQDCYEDWNGNGEKAMFGKKFVFERKGFEHNGTNLSLFFDDNISGDPESDIVAPYTRGGDFVSPSELVGKVLFPVHTGEAILEDSYYIHLVNKGLKANGFEVQIKL